MNPLANNKKGEEAANKAREVFAGHEVKFVDVRVIKDATNFLNELNFSDVVVLAGGDGTLHRFVNDVYDFDIKQQVYLYPCGSGNDFAHDIKDSIEVKDNLISLKDYIKSLPVVMVNGMTRRFLNGVGFGLDGHCCEVGDELRESSNGKPINYTAIAVKACLFKFSPTNVTVTIDGETRKFKRAWIAPTMFGRYYGGGMKAAPSQLRLSEDKVITSVVWHGGSRLGTLMRFSSIFSGTHIKHKGTVWLKTGHVVTVTADKPQTLQIDGETVRNVTSYTVRFGTGDD